MIASHTAWYFLTIRATRTTDYMFLMYLICHGSVDIKSLIMHKWWYLEPENIYKYTVVSNIRSEDYSGASSSLLSISPVHPVLRRLRHHCRCVWWLTTRLGVGGRLRLTWWPPWCFPLMRLFGSHGACRCHCSCALGVSKKFGALSGH